MTGSLTPGRYVGVAPEEEDADFDFEETLRKIHLGTGRIERRGGNIGSDNQPEF